jgi:sulfate transport system ATP-binding protein
VRPHELQVVAQAEEGAIPVTLSQALTVGPNTRLEFRRLNDEGFVDVELPRAEYDVLRDSIGLQAGSLVHLRARRVTRFETTASASAASG